MHNLTNAEKRAVAKELVASLEYDALVPHVIRVITKRIETLWPVRLVTDSVISVGGEWEYRIVKTGDDEFIEARFDKGPWGRWTRNSRAQDRALLAAARLPLKPEGE